MSRAATAYYIQDLDEAAPPRALNTEQYRLLGLELNEQRSTKRHAMLHPVYSVQDAGYYMADQDDAPYAGYFVERSEPARLRVRFNLPRQLIVGIVGIGVVASMLLGAANALPARGKTLVLSGYRDMSAAPASVVKAAAPDAPLAVIDATTAAPPPDAAPAAAPNPAGTYSVLGPPSLSVNQIEVVLKQYGSPAAGLGQHLYDLGVKYGIDPAYALAFFVHESGCGTKGVARVSKSIGNIRWTEGYGNYEGYRSYPNWESGMEDWYKLITDLYIGGWGLRTVDAIIPVYAPWGDNNHPPTYIASVKKMVDSWRGK